MTLREAERRRAQSEKDRARPQPDYVRSVREWAQINGFSIATARRIIASGEGPPVLQLSNGAKASATSTTRRGRRAASRAAGEARPPSCEARHR